MAVTVQPQFAYKGFEGGALVNPEITTFLSLSKAIMSASATASVIPGIYYLQSGRGSWIPPNPLYLTNSGNGKQLTVEPRHPVTIPPTQEVNAMISITNVSHALIR
jgi:hypothetical protein